MRETRFGKREEERESIVGSGRAAEGGRGREEGERTCFLWPILFADLNSINASN